ncbi:3351_t:CDS:2, partial [Dentiscutata heterogama]
HTNSDCFNASFTSNTSVDSIDSSDGTLDNDDIGSICENESETSDKEGQNEDRTKKDVDHVIDYSKVANTQHNTQTWVNTINEYFKNLNLPERMDKPYAPTSIHNCYCGIARHLLNKSCQDPKPNIFDKNQFPRLYSTIDGKIKLVQDTSSRRVNKSDSLTNNEIAQILNHEELLQDTPTAITYRVYFWLCLLCGLRGGDAKRLQYDHVKEGRVCRIPPDTQDRFTPVRDILYYMLRRGKHFTSKEFFLKIAYKKESSESSSNSSRPPLAPISNSDNQIARRIRPRISKPRPFKPFDASKPFVSPLKKASAKIIEEDTQEILPAITSNSAQEMP